MLNTEQTVSLSLKVYQINRERDTLEVAVYVTTRQK